MPTSSLPYQPEQEFLLPPSLREWLPEDHLAYFVSEVIDQLNLSAFYARYEGARRRNQPYHPAMMAKVLIYGYASGVFSSCKIVRRLLEDVAFRVLAAGHTPAHRTLCEFRRAHLAELSALFVQVVRLAQELKLVKLGTIGLDGTKVRANASKHKAMSYGRKRSMSRRIGSSAKCAAVTLCPRSWPAGSSAWPRSASPRHAWRRARPKPTVPAAGMTATIASPRAAAGTSSATSGCRRIGRTRTSPIRSRAS